MIIYIEKSNTENIIIFPAPTETENYIVIEVPDDFDITENWFNPDTLAFENSPPPVTRSDREYLRQKAYNRRTDPMVLEFIRKKFANEMPEVTVEVERIHTTIP
ncbi:hypothetical protein [Desulfoluna spongiiphila]|uniref:Uncharacterized protein n=1 Tax=Desulfoluna spongiiphila TaxID=419481 RepID=A0A1G5ACX9_9BACT|nr:hypothetical protein [Desulfoluna spongiiphila]SCX75697.1 hypothetical protein SAMN05216233_10155 [Desulfoluna spongiiphila]